jgi:hypothetical protein
MMLPRHEYGARGIMSHVIAFPTPVPRAAVGEPRAGELFAFGRNDIATVLETIELLRESGLTDMLDAFNRGPVVARGRRAGAPSR